jgi:U-box domain
MMKHQEFDAKRSPQRSFFFMEDEPYDGTLTEAAREYGIPIPSEFLCPITLEIMVSPLMSRYGHNFEHEAIVEWIDSSGGTCPLTRQRMRLRDLVPNKGLSDKIAMWIWVNALPTPQQCQSPTKVVERYHYKEIIATVTATNIITC